MLGLVAILRAQYTSESRDRPAYAPMRWPSRGSSPLRAGVAAAAPAPVRDFDGQLVQPADALSADFRSASWAGEGVNPAAGAGDAAPVARSCRRAAPRAPARRDRCPPIGRHETGRCSPPSWRRRGGGEERAVRMAAGDSAGSRGRRRVQPRCAFATACSFAACAPSTPRSGGCPGRPRRCARRERLLPSESRALACASDWVAASTSSVAARRRCARLSAGWSAAAGGTFRLSTGALDGGAGGVTVPCSFAPGTGWSEKIVRPSGVT